VSRDHRLKPGDELTLKSERDHFSSGRQGQCPWVTTILPWSLERLSNPTRSAIEFLSRSNSFRFVMGAPHDLPLAKEQRQDDYEVPEIDRKVVPDVKREVRVVVTMCTLVVKKD